jgi:DNA-binding MarR family transcriptional regulator
MVDREPGHAGWEGGRIAFMNHVRIGAGNVSHLKSEEPRVQIDKLQAQLDQLRARLVFPEPAGELGEDEIDQARLVKEILRARRRREKVFGDDLFGEPAWDILLELFAAEQAQQRLSVSSVCYVSAVPATTALRWIKRLEDEGWLERRCDPLDARRYWIELSPRASETMRKFVARMAIRPF